MEDTIVRIVGLVVGLLVVGQTFASRRESDSS